MTSWNIRYFSLYLSLIFLQEKWHLGTVQGVILYKVLAFILLSPSNQYPVVFHRILFKHANLISNLHQMCTSCSCVHMGVTSLVTVIAAVSLRRLLPSYCLILFLFWVTSFLSSKYDVTYVLCLIL